MATASAPAAPAPATPRRPRRAALRLLPAAATIVGVAALLELVYAPYLNYDARYALVWARDLASGVQPDYTADFAPTPHPLETAVSSLATPFETGADTLLVWLVLLCFGALVWLTYRLGSELFSPWAGAVAALVVLTRPMLERDALLGYQDTAFAALIVAAVLLEARRPRRGEAVLALLAVAGLMRPEAWILAGLYVGWMWPAVDRSRRLRLAGIAALSPLLWAAGDWFATGDPLHSLHGTAELAEANDRRRAPEQAPYWTAQYFGHALREPIVAGIPVGLYFAWRHRRSEAMLPLAAAAAMTAVFAVGPLFGLPLTGRYVRTPSVLLALFYGLAVCGWMLLPPGRERRIWLGVGGVAAARSPALHRAVRACGSRVSTTEHRPIPHLRWWLDTKPFSVGTIEAGASPLRRVVFTPRDTRAMRRFYREAFPRFRPPPGYRAIYRNRSWRALAAPGCVRRPPA